MAAFQMCHELEFALTVTGRCPRTKAVNSVECKLCAFHGREASECNADDDNDGDDADEGKKKRKRTTNIKFWTPPYRPFLYKSHHESMHKVKWLEYQTLNDVQKAAYFKKAEKNSLITYYDLDESTITLEIEAVIVDVLVGELLLSDDNDTFKEHALNFLRKSPFADANGDECYRVVVKEATQFTMAVRMVAQGCSFAQVSACILIAKEATKMALVGSPTADTVSKFARIIAVRNWSVLRELLMRHVWAFSLALDGAEHQSQSYLDLRIRFELRGDIYDLHVMAVPLVGRHTGLNMANHAMKVLDVLCPAWKTKLIGGASDGTGNMAGRFSGALTLILRECSPHVYRVWCALHQIEIPLKRGYAAVEGGGWLQRTTTIIAHLRAQQLLVQEMGNTCPYFSSRWVATTKVTSWFVNYRDDVVAYYEGAQNQPPASVPTDTWWIYLFAINHMSTLVWNVVQGLQGQKTLLSTQEQRFDVLRTQLMACVGALGPLEEGEDEAPELGHGLRVKVGRFQASYDNTSTFLDNLGPFVAGKLAALVPIARGLILNDVATLFLNAIDGIHDISALRNNNGEAIYDEIPAVLPGQLVALTSAQFGDLLTQQKERWLVTHPVVANPKSLRLSRVEDEFTRMKFLYRTDAAFKARVDGTPDTAGFQEAWSISALGQSFDVLRVFVGGLASPYPTTGTVESDFSVLRWEKDDHRMALQDFTLEAILQCKESDRLDEIYTYCTDLYLEGN